MPPRQAPPYQGPLGPNTRWIPPPPPTGGSSVQADARDYNWGYTYARQDRAGAFRALADNPPQPAFPADWAGNLRVGGRYAINSPYWWQALGIQDALEPKPPRQFADLLPQPEAPRSMPPSAYADGVNFALTKPVDALNEWNNKPGPLDERRRGILDGLAELASRQTFQRRSNTPGTTGGSPNHYWEGYQLARTNPRAAQLELRRYPNPAPGTDQYERNRGIRDGLASAGGGWPGPWPTPGPQNLYYEVYASAFGKGIPLDIAENIRRQAGILSILGPYFQLLGDRPSDARRGFRLSGPDGRLAAMVTRAQALGRLPPTPQQIGLPFWAGAQTTNGIQLLGERDLERLGLLF